MESSVPEDIAVTFAKLIAPKVRQTRGRAHVHAAARVLTDELRWEMSRLNVPKNERKSKKPF